MNIAKFFLREPPLSKVAAVFDSGVQARDAAARVEQLPHIRHVQVQVVGPFDDEWTRGLAPDAVGIWRTTVGSMLGFGVIGLLTGLLVFAALIAGNVNFVTRSPSTALIVLLALGSMFGLLAGGVLPVRPGDSAVIAPVRAARQHGRWSVIVHPFTRAQFDGALLVLAKTGGNVFHTL